MRFLVDECTGPVVARHLSSLGHDVFSVFDTDRGADDDSVIRRAASENRILITNDKDFGIKVFRDGRPHKGVILLRLSDETPAGKIQAITRFLAHLGGAPYDRFAVVTDKAIRYSTKI